MGKLLPDTLRGRIYVLVALAFLPAIAILVYSYGQVRSLAMQNQEQEVVRMADVVAADYQRLVDETGVLLRGLARIEEVRDGQSPACHRLLTRVLEANPRYTSLAVVDPDGYRLCGALEAEAPLYLGDRSYVIRATGTGRFAMGDYQVGRISGRSTVGFAYPLVDDGVSRGILVAALDLDQLSDHAPAAQLSRESTLTLTDRNGNVLLRTPDGPGWVGEAVPEGFPIHPDRAIARSSLVEGTDLDGRSRIFAVRPLQGEGESPEGFIALAVDPAVLGEVEAIFGLNFLVLALGLGGVLILAWALGHYSILQPVNAIVAAEDALKRGDLEARIRMEDAPDELRRIARAFDEMARRVQERESPAAAPSSGLDR